MIRCDEGFVLSCRVSFGMYLLVSSITLGTIGFSNASMAYLNYPTQVSQTENFIFFCQVSDFYKCHFSLLVNEPQQQIIYDFLSLYSHVFKFILDFIYFDANFMHVNILERL